MTTPTGPDSRWPGRPASAEKSAVTASVPKSVNVTPGAPTLSARVGRDLAPRVASGLVMAAVVAAVVWAGSIPLAILLALVGAVVAWEWGRIVRGTDIDAAMSAHVATVVAGIVLTGAGLAGPAILGIVIGTILTAVLSFGRNAMLSALGVLFASLPGSALLWFRSDPGFGGWAVVFIITAVVATDVGAYFCGRLIGGPKLWPQISPNKTWAGLIGGVAAAALFAAIFARFMSGATPSHLALSGALLALFAQAGDLAESALKRRFGTKDASALIPGHGGFMDRVDGLAMASIAAAAWVAVHDTSAPARAFLTW
jgi:phosphatidate cytidylyltransferase